MENKSGEMYLCQGSFYIYLLEPQKMWGWHTYICPLGGSTLTQPGVNRNRQGFQHHAGIYKFCQDEDLFFTVILKNNSFLCCITVTCVFLSQNGCTSP